MRYQWMIKWIRPSDDSWMYHIPRRHFKSKKELKEYLKDNTETEGTRFIIVEKLKDTAII